VIQRTNDQSGIRSRAAHAGAGVGVWLLASIVGLVALLSPWAFARVEMPGGARMARWSAQNLQLSLLPPVWMGDVAAEARVEAARAAGEHVPGRMLGTDRIGRDVAARLVAGSALSLALGLAAAVVATAASAVQRLRCSTIVNATSAYTSGYRNERGPPVPCSST